LIDRCFRRLAAKVNPRKLMSKSVLCTVPWAGIKSSFTVLLGLDWPVDRYFRSSKFRRSIGTFAS
jgi:hypothetical protein